MAEIETPVRRPWLFWLLVAAASSYCAEVISGSFPFPFFKAWGLFVILPLYGLHSLILAAIVYHHGRPRLHVLFLAGILFGLYEAYITKVLWDPPWGAAGHLFGIDPIATAGLILWWHPFMSFILPLLLVEFFATSSRGVIAGLPPTLRRRLSRPRNVYLLAVFFGFLQSASLPPGGALLSGASGLLVLGLLLYLWRRFGGASRSMDELLPRGRAFTVMAVLLALLYGLSFVALRPEAIPGLGPQVTIWVIYALVILGLRRALANSRLEPLPALEVQPPSGRRLSGFVAVYLAACLLFGFLPPPLKSIAFIINFIPGPVFGIAFLVYTIRQLRQSARS